MVGYNFSSVKTEQGDNTLEVNGASSVVTCTKSGTRTFALGNRRQRRERHDQPECRSHNFPVDTVIVGQYDVTDT